MSIVPTPAVRLGDTDAARQEQYRDALAASGQLAAAGLPGAQLTDETLAITMPSLNIREACTLAAQLRQGMTAFFTTANALSAAGEEHGIPLSATVVRSQVQLADLTIQEADRLATLLGRPTPSDVDPDDLDDPPSARAVVDRLTGAIEDATGVTPAADLTPACFCVPCGHGATVRLLPMAVQTAERLLSALSQGRDR